MNSGFKLNKIDLIIPAAVIFVSACIGIYLKESSAIVTSYISMMILVSGIFFWLAKIFKTHNYTFMGFTFISIAALILVIDNNVLQYRGTRTEAFVETLAVVLFCVEELYFSKNKIRNREIQLIAELVAGIALATILNLNPIAIGILQTVMVIRCMIICTSESNNENINEYRATFITVALIIVLTQYAKFIDDKVMQIIFLFNGVLLATTYKSNTIARNAILKTIQRTKIDAENTRDSFVLYQKQLSQKNISMINVIQHDIKTVMSWQEGTKKLFKRDEENSPEITVLAYEMMEASYGKLKALTGVLNRFSVVNHNNKTEMIYLKELIEDASKLVLLNGIANIKGSSRLRANSAIVHGVFSNIFVVANKALVEAGGKQVSIEINEENENAVISVEYNSNMDELTTLRNTEKSKKDTTGVGVPLVLIDNDVRALKGTLEIESFISNKTNIKLTIPLNLHKSNK
ncbi:hypothetical protein A3715_18120 [Oleiphilus sp. HI0009]|nr:hypothetical protein A3715_18120 [Oleiphilus sp. HI0009]